MTANVVSNGVSNFVASQMPEFIQYNDPMLVAFVTAYYQFLESNAPGGGQILYQLRNLLNYRMIDTTSADFLQYFMADLLKFWPTDTALNPVKLLKNATKFYQCKGSQQSLEFLFQALYGLPIEVYYPRNNVLRLSGGQWQLPQAVELLYPTGSNVDVQLLVGRLGVGSISNVTCVIESAAVVIDPELNTEIIELYLSNLSQDQFTPGDSLIINYAYANGQSAVFDEPIIGALSAIVVDPNNEGLGYVGTQYYSNGTISYPGNPVSIIGGTSNNGSVIEAVAYVQNVTSGSVTGVTVIDGGYGFQLNPNTLCTFVGGSGEDATAIVSGVDGSNADPITLATDSLYYKANVELGATDYGFANVSGGGNSSTNLFDALTFVTLNVAPVTSINLTNGGTGYTAVPNLTLLSVFDSDYSSNLESAYDADPTADNLAAWTAARQPVLDYGRIVAVDVLVGGTGYSNSTDTIVVDSAVGFGAEFDFITVDGAITDVIITNQGCGYAFDNHPLLIDTVDGSGGVLVAYGDNDDYDLSLSVSTIGAVESIWLENSGFGYDATPLVSLRNQDLTIEPIPSDEQYIQGEPVWQGANVNVASYVAYVDGYQRANAVLRVYNYVGSLNLSANLVSANQNATLISANTYGNGKARANAEFLGGLIQYPGYWSTSAGQLSEDQYFQSNSVYQNYSYIVKVEKALAAYRNTLLNLVHPAGTGLFAICTVTDDTLMLTANEAEPIQISNTALYTGSINVNAYGNGLVTGVGTDFTAANVGDLLYIAGQYPQTKVILTIINADAVIVESNTMYFAPDQLTMTNGSNVLVSTAGVSNLAVNDIIQTDVSGNSQTSIVQSVNDANGYINVNTVFAANATNVDYLVWPTLNEATYNVWTTL